MSHATPIQPAPDAPDPTPPDAAGHTDSGSAAQGRVRTTEAAALGNLIDHHAQIMDMLGRDPDGAIDDAWEHAGEILALSIHAVSTVLRQRRIRREQNTLRPLCERAIRDGVDMSTLAARVLGMGRLA